MIIQNGNIEVKKKSGGGIDPETDYPIPATESWEPKIPCQYRANTYSNKGRSNGEAFTIAAYEVLIEGVNFDAERVRLSNLSGRTLGEFSVISAEPLPAVQMTKILL